MPEPPPPLRPRARASSPRRGTHRNRLTSAAPRRRPPQGPIPHRLLDRVGEHQDRHGRVRLVKLADHLRGALVGQRGTSIHHGGVYAPLGHPLATGGHRAGPGHHVQVLLPAHHVGGRLTERAMVLDEQYAGDLGTPSCCSRGLPCPLVSPYYRPPLALCAPSEAGHDTMVSNRLTVRLTGAEAAATRMALPPSPRVSRARSVNRRGTPPERKERALLAMEETDAHSAESQPRCEYGKTLFSEGECQSTGEVLQSDGSLLCVPHAELLRLEEREATMLAGVFEMDKWLDQPRNRIDNLHWRRVLRERDEALKQLRLNRALIEAHKEAN